MTVPKITLPLPLTFGSSSAANWKMLKKIWKNYSILSDLDPKPRKYQVALLKNNLGDDAVGINEGFHFEIPDTVRIMAEILTMLEFYAVGEGNETYERFIFNRRCQEEGKDVVFQVDPGASANLLPLRNADSVMPDARVLKMWTTPNLKPRTPADIPESANSSRLSKGRFTLGMISMALRLERYTEANVNAARSHRPAMALAVP
ncbi:hypothetical protein O3P69_009153 [Scylla paramamosain]|uniref:Uncharacterized protein n=1 Tax=Scylla paramamosain TaxID=85552 RepID=A0AAW0T9F4_SCYPA